MKKLFPLCAAAVICLTACEKIEDLRDRDRPCPVVSTGEVPASVLDGFEARHAGTPVKTWYNKDDKGFVALFISSGKEVFAYFDNNGNFQKEVTEGEHEDEDDKGCECETED